MRSKFNLDDILTYDPLGVLEILRRMPVPIKKYVLLSNADVPSNYIHLREYILKSDNTLVENFTKQYVGYMNTGGINILAITFKRDGMYLHGKNQSNLIDDTDKSNAILGLQDSACLRPNHSSNEGKESNYGTQIFHISSADDLTIAEEIVDHFLRNGI